MSSDEVSDIEEQQPILISVHEILINYLDFLVDKLGGWSSQIPEITLDLLMKMKEANTAGEDSLMDLLKRLTKIFNIYQKSSHWKVSGQKELIQYLRPILSSTLGTSYPSEIAEKLELSYQTLYQPLENITMDHSDLLACTETISTSSTPVPIQTKVADAKRFLKPASREDLKRKFEEDYLAGTSPLPVGLASNSITSNVGDKRVSFQWQGEHTGYRLKMSIS